MSEADQLWQQIFAMIWTIRDGDDDWPDQGPKLRELTRLASALASVCEEIKKKQGMTPEVK